MLDSEEAALKELQGQYSRALKDINAKVKGFQADIDLLDQALNTEGLDDATKTRLLSQKRSKVYQKNYQAALKGQVNGILDKLHGDEYATIDKYLNGCYETGFIGTMYSLAGQGIPVVVPIDQAAAVKAVLTDSKISKGLYEHLGVDVSGLKKSITQEISRGIASSLPYNDIARNIANVSKAPLARANTIARTEGHRIQQTSAVDAQQKAKAKGADVVKQWDAALDARTRDSHARVDGEIRALDEKFSNGLMFPGDPNGSAAEVVNCRCVSNTRAKWALDEAELETLKERAEYYGLDKTDNFEEYKEKYLGASDRIKLAQEGEMATPPKEFDGVFDDFAELTISNAEREALLKLQALSASTGNEYGIIISDEVSEPFTSGLAGAVKLSTNDYGDALTLFHSHTNATPPSSTDFQKLLNKKVAKIGSIGYNGDAYVSYVGNGEIPSQQEFDIAINVIRHEADDDIFSSPNFENWSFEERNYMAIREQAYRIARHFGWTLEGGRINGK